MRQDVKKDDREIDLALRQAVVAEVGSERFDLWFGASVLLRLSDGEVQVLAPDQFTLDRLRGQFRADLTAAGRKLVGHEVSVRFVRYAVEATVDETSAETTAATPSETTPTTVSVTSSTRRRFARLSDFIVGDSNRLAYTAADMVASRIGSVSPLFLYGPTGCGKTHLLEGMWTAARQAAGYRRVLYLSAEQFTSMFLEALQGKGLPSFRHKYRKVDVLLIDDVQFFSGKRATLVELQHTLDALMREGRQLILAADRCPADLHGFGSELVARMSGGLVCALELPDATTRRGIIQRVADQMDVDFSHEVLDRISSQLQGDARQLTGALNKLEATSRAYGRPIDLAMVESALLDVFRATRRVVNLPDIERAVCDVFGLDASCLQSNGKARSISRPRALAMWLARKYTRAAYSEIGAYFGRRSHSTVISAQRQVTRWVTQGESIRVLHGQCAVDEAIRRVESQIRAG
jgi:chromosomal replication initiator protein